MDAPCFIPGNFKTDATVRLSHGRPRGHRPSVRKRPSDKHARQDQIWDSGAGMYRPVADTTPTRTTTARAK
jgi:hypothetical protein